MFDKLKKFFKKDEDTLKGFLPESHENYFDCRYYAGHFLYYDEFYEWCENNCYGFFLFDCPLQKDLNNHGVIRSYTSLWFSEYRDYVAFVLSYKDQLDPPAYISHTYKILRS